jgi:pimeloyl-ACP methyl ester carboxylesterase
LPAFFVHGVPETHQMWEGVLSHLPRTDVIAPDMPGFACALPSGFGCTKEEYLAWLIAEVESVGAPVDLVGHDWGALLVERLVSVRPDLVRTWAVGAGAIDETYVWHPIARMWQTPGVGEQVMQGMTADAMLTVLTGEGVPEDRARALVSHIDDRMKAAILPLYRSATEIGKEWGPDLDRVRTPGLLVWGKNDPYMAIDFAQKLAARTRARLVTLEGAGHWWPLQRPAEAAAALEALWAAV